MQWRSATAEFARNSRKRQPQNELQVSDVDSQSGRHALTRTLHRVAATLRCRLRWRGELCEPVVFPPVRQPRRRRSSALQGSFGRSIVVEDAMNPDSADIAVRTIGEDRGVFDRNITLIIEPIRDPAAQCFGRKLAFIHRYVKRMFVVISAPANCAQFSTKVSRSRSPVVINRVLQARP